MKACALVSGGKDSIVSAYLAETQGFEVDELVTIRPSDPHSMLYHTPNLELVALQAAAWGKRHTSIRTEGNGEAAETTALERALAGRTGWVIAGAIASNYQWGRLQRTTYQLGLRLFTPLWGKRPSVVVRAEVEAGLDVRLAHLAAEPLSADLAGKRLDLALLAELERRSRERRTLNVAGEGGEFETLVVDAPFFRARLVWDSEEVLRTPSTTTWVPHGARLEPKGRAGDGGGRA